AERPPPLEVEHTSFYPRGMGRTRRKLWLVLASPLPWLVRNFQGAVKLFRSFQVATMTFRSLTDHSLPTRDGVRDHANMKYKLCKRRSSEFSQRSGRKDRTRTVNLIPTPTQTMERTEFLSTYRPIRR